MFSADEARKQSAENIQRKIQEKLQEFEQLIKQAAQNGDRKLITDEILCNSKSEYEFIKQVGERTRTTWVRCWNGDTIDKFMLHRSIRHFLVTKSLELRF